MIDLPAAVRSGRRLLAAVSTALLIVASASAGSASPLAVYSIGNSLTVDLRASGGVETLSAGESTGIVHDYHVRCGSSLSASVADIVTGLDFLY
jgi:hypothetical protein